MLPQQGDPVPASIDDPSPVRPPQFSLRYLLLVTAGVAGVCSLAAVFGWVPVLVVVWLILTIILFLGKHVASAVFLLFGGLAIVPTCCPRISSGTGPAAQRAVCGSNLKQLGLALYLYHNDNGCFPPPQVSDSRGRPLYSWRVLLLPYLEQHVIYDQWRLDEPWDSPHNRPLADQTLRAFQCPAAHFTPSMTDYLAVVGLGTAWESGKCLSLDDIGDGASNTIAVVEVRGSQIGWAEPVDLGRGQMSLTINDPARPSIGSNHEDIANVLFCDGRVLALPETTPPADLDALLTRDGREPVGHVLK